MKVLYIIIPLVTVYVLSLAFSAVDTILTSTEEIEKVQNIRFTTKGERLNKQNEIVAADRYKGLPDYSDKYTSPVHDPELIEYKNKALLKILAKENGLIKPKEPSLEREPGMANGTKPDISFDESYQKQIPSNTRFNLQNPNFNYRIHSDFTVTMKSTATNGIVIPSVKYTIENSRGNILIESRTDNQGRVKESLKVKNGERLYIRFYSPGIIEDKILLTKEGEE